jgi:cytidyltransferase-like protein
MYVILYMFVAYTDMCADLCHYGHFNYLDLVYEQCLSLANGDDIRLIVGIHDDETIVSYKRTPIMTVDERCRMIKYHKRVDQVIPNAPLHLLTFQTPIFPKLSCEKYLKIYCFYTLNGRQRLYKKIRRRG